MRRTPWNDEHARIVHDAAPPVDDPTPEELERTWIRVRAAVAAERPVPRRRRGRIVVGTAVAAALLGAGGVAAASVYTTHTGRGPVDAEDARLGGPGERLDPAAPDYADAVAQIATEVRFPSDQARASFVAAEVRVDQRGAVPGETSVSTGALRYWSARSAVCAWADVWAAASQAGDTATKEQAASELEQAPSWPAVTAIDAKQVISTGHRHGPDLTLSQLAALPSADDTAAGYFPLLRQAARLDDVDGMAAVLARWGACDANGADMPHLPRANPPGPSQGQ